ncbi:MAG: Flp family type IVb pilin [Beijerinckiaceae bacterium]
MAAFSFSDRVTRFLLAEEGATAIEYGLIMSLVTLVVISGMILMGAGATGMWGKLETQAGGALR